MPLVKSRRPKSAVSAIKQRKFSPFLSQKRLHDVQEICKEDGLDCILIILGIDGRFNKGCSELMDYLLFDMLATRREEIARTKMDEETFEDLMICVHRQYVDVYCNPVNYWLLIPYIVHWPGLRLHCLPEAEYYADFDKAEEYKVRVLLRMVDGGARVGVPFFCQRDDLTAVKFDKMAVEQWPVVQASALEEISGGRGFFTMKHEVADVSARVHAVLREIDPVVLEATFDNVLPAFEAQFENIFQMLDAHRLDTQTWRAARFGEPLASYFEHGCAVMGPAERKSDFHPLLLFGSASEKRVLRMKMEGLPVDVPDLDETPTHLVVQGAIPRHPDLVCARTYLLEGTADLDWLHAPADGEAAKQSRRRREDVKTLAAAYSCLVAGCERAAALLADGGTAKEVAAEVRQLVQETSGQAAKSVEIRVEASNPQAAKKGSFLYSIQGVIFNVQNAEGRVLGSVLFADALVVSIIEVAAGGGRVAGTSLSLTFGVPRFQLWPGQDSTAVRKHVTDQCGQPVVMDTVPLLLAGQNGLIADMSCVFFPGHLLLSHRRHGHSLVPLGRVEYFEGESMGDPSLILLACPDGERTATDHLCRDGRLVLLVETKTRFKSALYAKLIPRWKEAGVLETLDKVPAGLAAAYAFLSGPGLRAADLRGLARAVRRQPHLEPFLHHLEAACCLRRRPAPTRAEVDALLPAFSTAPGALENRPTTPEGPTLVLTVVCGLPGNYKEQLCSCLTRLVKDETRWMVLRPPSLEAMMDLRQRLSSGGASSRRPLPGQGRKHLRGLLCCPRFVGPAQVAALVGDLEATKIGSITVCVDPAAAFVENRLTMPLLLDQCASGWANNVIFTSGTNQDKSPALEDLQLMLRAINPRVTTIYAPRGEVTRTEELEAILSEDAFSQEELARTRILSSHRLTYPAAPAALPPQLGERQVTFKRLLVRIAFMNRLRELKKKLQPWPYAGNVYFVQGRVTFVNEKGRMVEFWHHSLSGSTWSQTLDALPTPPGAPPVQQDSFVNFVGCGLDDAALRDWLRSTAPQPMVERPLRARADLTPAELEQIHKEKHLSPLPSGYFYNGVQFMNMDGDKFDRHPEFPLHVQEFLDAKNEKIRAHNEKVRAQEFKDLFAE